MAILINQSDCDLLTRCIENNPIKHRYCLSGSTPPLFVKEVKNTVELQSEFKSKVPLILSAPGSISVADYSTLRLYVTQEFLGPGWNNKRNEPTLYGIEVDLLLNKLSALAEMGELGSRFKKTIIIVSDSKNEKDFEELVPFFFEDIDENKRVGFKNKDQKEQIPPVYYAMLKLPNGKTVFNYDCNFRNGLAVVMERKGKFGLIDANGNTVIPLQYDYISNVIVNDILLFCSGSTCGFIKKNNFVIAEYHDCTLLQQTHDHTYLIKYNGGKSYAELDLDGFAKK